MLEDWNGCSKISEEETDVQGLIYVIMHTVVEIKLRKTQECREYYRASLPVIYFPPKNHFLHLFPFISSFSLSFLFLRVAHNTYEVVLLYKIGMIAFLLVFQGFLNKIPQLSELGNRIYCLIGQARNLRSACWQISSLWGLRKKICSKPLS
jgi:hypothetical protein